MAQTVPVVITYALNLAHRETALEENITIKNFDMPYKNSLFQVLSLDWGSHLGQAAAAAQLLAGEKNTP